MDCFMREGFRKIVRGGVAVVLLLAGFRMAQGQQYSPPNAGIPGSAGVAPPSAVFGPQTLSVEEQFAQLRNQLQAQQAQIQANEAELRALRAQQPQAAGAAATPVAFDPAGTSAAVVAAPAADPFCTPKEVPIIDKPTFAVHG